MGYGSRAVDLLTAYYQGSLTSALPRPSPPMGVFGGEGAGGADEIQSLKSLHAITTNLTNTTSNTTSTDDKGTSLLLNEHIQPRKKLPSLLTPITERPCERLHWLGKNINIISILYRCSYYISVYYVYMHTI